MKNLIRSDFLFARPTFLGGVARLFDFCGHFDSYNKSDSEEEADAKAIFTDWHVVGLDITTAMERFGHSKKLLK